MDWLNLNHLFYFWNVARSGGVTAACEELGVAQPTISTQLRTLERRLGSPLFDRRGRRMALTELGELVFRYADEMFTIARELEGAISGGRPAEVAPLHVGVADVLPKLIVREMLRPALELEDAGRIVCSEGKTLDLLGDLAAHKLDILLTDMPSSPGLGFRVFSHLLGESGVTLFAPKGLAARIRRGFPASLRHQPFLAPMRATALRGRLDRWFTANDARPRIVAEFDDSALLKALGGAGMGAFVGPTVIRDEICRQYNVHAIGALEGVREQFYAISVDRRLRNPSVIALTESARTRLLE